MNVELTIQEMFNSYPTLFKERADCLNHLFCCIGNGYRWCNGELVLDYCSGSESELRSHLVNNKAYQHNKLSLRAESLLYEEQRVKEGFYERFDRETAEELMTARQKTINKISDNEYYDTPRKKRWSFYINIPGHEEINYFKNFAYLWNYPEDVAPDWLEAIEECKSLLREDGFDV